VTVFSCEHHRGAPQRPFERPKLVLSKDEARRVAANFAKLRELLPEARPFLPPERGRLAFDGQDARLDASVGL
jgi:hypothetical protein